ncbi:MAG: hypothetical protein CMD28_02165 [Flavobacteriales bacterium]|nr:hypothetical protein [Flavobacteriales bacterium]|tara:strand:- start:1633 stop:1818 length:186 start_codon:yes stop_codon:yes gene_type:complete
MIKKKKYAIFDISSGKFEKDHKDVDFSEYLDMLDAERQIARRIIKQKLDKISPDEYKESTD